jgi:hypothetical protein
VVVDAVEPLDHGPAAGAVRPEPHQLGQQQAGVVVALARPLLELAGAQQQR